MRVVAHIISYILQPLVMPTAVFALLIYHFPLLTVGATLSQYLLLLSLLFTFLMPAFALLAMYQLRLIKTLDIVERHRRTLPYLVTIIIYSILVYIIIKQDLGLAFAISLICITISIALTLVINLFWKISAHSIGIGGLVGMLARLSMSFEDDQLFYYFLLSVLLSGVVMSARLYLRVHTKAQVYTGFAMGIAISYAGSFFIY